MSQHLPLTGCMEQKMEEDERDMEELSFVPSAVSEPRWALHMCDHKCKAQGFKFFEIAANVSAEGAAHTVNLCMKCNTERRVKHGEEEVASSKWALVEQRAFRGKLRAAFGVDQFLRRMCEQLNNQESVGQNGVGRRSTDDAMGDRQQLATCMSRRTRRSSSLLRHNTDLRVGGFADAPSILCGEVRRLGKIF